MVSPKLAKPGHDPHLGKCGRKRLKLDTYL